MSNKYPRGSTGGPNWKPQTYQGEPFTTKAPDKKLADTVVRDATKEDTRVSLALCEAVAVASLILGAVFGFVVCLVTR